MPHATTNKSPAELFLNRKLRIHLDLIIPSEQAENTESNTHIPTIFFTCGEREACRNYTKNSKWKFGEITSRLGKLHYKILLDDGRSWIRHLNQMRPIGKNTPIVNDSASNTNYWETEGLSYQVDNKDILQMGPALQLQYQPLKLETAE